MVNGNGVNDFLENPKMAPQSTSKQRWVQRAVTIRTPYAVSPREVTACSVNSQGIFSRKNRWQVREKSRKTMQKCAEDCGKSNGGNGSGDQRARSRNLFCGAKASVIKETQYGECDLQNAVRVLRSREVTACSVNFQEVFFVKKTRAGHSEKCRKNMQKCVGTVPVGIGQ